VARLTTVLYPHLGGRDCLLFRIGGPGLGNLLFPWARALLASKTYGYKRIFPTWPQIKVGPFLRQERDLRCYSTLFAPIDDEISGIAKAHLLVVGRFAPEDALRSEDRSRDGRGWRVVVFRGMLRMFEPLRGQAAIIRQAIIQAVEARSSATTLQAQSRGPEIGIHVRLGDFRRPSETALRDRETNVRIPLSWYRNVLRNLRSACGQSVRARVCSDGSDDELQELLSEPDVYRSDASDAVRDLLGLAECMAIVSSRSTFSAWAAYLGAVPTVCYPGTPTGLFPSLEDCVTEEVDEGGSLSRQFASFVRARHGEFAEMGVTQ